MENALRLMNLQPRTEAARACAAIRSSTKPVDLVGAKLVDNERKIMLITNEGIIIKMAVSDISIIGRNTSGVKLMSIDAESGIAVASIAKVRESDKDEDEEDEFLEEQDGEETESENTADVMGTVTNKSKKIRYP